MSSAKMRRALLLSFWFLLCSGLATVDSANNSWDLAAVVQDRIFFYTRNMTLTKQYVIKEIPTLSEMTYDDTTKTMYMVDAKRMSIFSFKFKEEHYTAKKIIQLNNTVFKAITFDPLTRTLFWINNFEKSIVKLHVPLNGKPGSPVVVQIFPEFILQSIAVDSCTRHVYWSYGNKTQQSVERINYDGSNRTTIVQRTLLATQMEAEMEVEVNYDESRLHWFDLFDFKIKIERRRSVDVNRKLIIRVKTYVPTYLETDRDTMYWLNTLNRLGWKFPKNDEKDDLPVTIISTSDRNIIMNNLIARNSVVSCSLVPVTVNETYQRAPRTVSESTTFTDKEYLEDEEEAREIHCLHGGVFNETNKLCECQPGYLGVICEISLCHHYCRNGECFLNEHGQPECKCPGQFKGIRCEKDICADYCLDGGECSFQNVSCAYEYPSETETIACEYRKNVHDMSNDSTVTDNNNQTF